MFIKVALDGGLSEGFIICARTILGAAVLLPMAVRAGAVRPILDRRWWALALASAQVIVPFGLITFGENHIPPRWPGSSSPPRRCSSRCWPRRSTPTSAPAAGAWSASCSGWWGSSCSSAWTSAATPRRSRRADGRRGGRVLRVRRPHRQARVHGRAAGRRGRVRPGDQRRGVAAVRARVAADARPGGRCRALDGGARARAAPAWRSCSSTPRSRRSGRRRPRSWPMSRRRSRSSTASCCSARTSPSAPSPAWS